MRIGRFEIGWVKPLGLHGVSKMIPVCGCTIYTFGPWYFTVLAKDCQGGDLEPVIPKPKTEVDQAAFRMMGLLEQIMYAPESVEKEKPRLLKVSKAGKLKVSVKKKTKRSKVQKKKIVKRGRK